MAGVTCSSAASIAQATRVTTSSPVAIRRTRVLYDVLPSLIQPPGEGAALLAGPPGVTDGRGGSHGRGGRGTRSAPAGRRVTRGGCVPRAGRGGADRPRAARPPREPAPVDRGCSGPAPSRG